MSDEVRPPASGKLSEFPDWTYLLDEIDSVYRFGSNGGSDVIAQHRRTVRDRLQAVVEADPYLIERTGDPLPVRIHLGRAIDRGSDGPLSGMTRALARVVDSLPWRLAYRNVPEKLTRDLVVRKRCRDLRSRLVDLEPDQRRTPVDRRPLGSVSVGLRLARLAGPANRAADLVWWSARSVVNGHH